MNTLKAEKRSMDIKAKKLRREGYVTGNVFGREMKESVPVKIEKAIVDRLLKTCHKGSQVMLDIEGEKMNVLIKDVEFNPLKGQVDEIDFQALVSNEKVHSVAEIVLVGHEKDAGGVLEQLLEEVQFKAYPSALVDKVEVDVSNMKVGDSIKVKDLTLSSDKDVDVMTDPETTVVTLQYVHNSEADDDADEEAADGHDGAGGDDGGEREVQRLHDGAALGHPQRLQNNSCVIQEIVLQKGII